MTTFDGCIRNPVLNSIAFGPPDREYDTQSCTSFMEPGTFFRDDAGYLTLRKSDVTAHVVFVRQ